MVGFKSFLRKTELPFSTDINVVVGPNGSGKSNVADALCFVLGRLSSKSLRAAKSSNLIFAGTKSAGPSKEATVEIIFDNTDKTFSIPGEEISIKRILRKNGQSIYNVATAKEVSFNKTTVGTVITDSATGKITGLTAGEVSATSTDASFLMTPPSRLRTCRLGHRTGLRNLLLRHSLEVSEGNGKPSPPFRQGPRIAPGT